MAGAVIPAVIGTLTLGLWKNGVYTSHNKINAQAKG